jgi:hypothetical protein
LQTLRWHVEGKPWWLEDAATEWGLREGPTGGG